MSLSRGALVELEIEKAAAGGRMLARHHGQVVLVWGGIPGERVTARIERVGKGVAYADAVDVLTPSADRRATGADPRCGGNVFAHIAYDRQVRLKGEIIQDALGRIGRVPLPAPPAVVPSPEEGYRMRARLHVHERRIGFYREGTHQLCDAAPTRQLLAATHAWIDRAQSLLRSAAFDGVAAVEIAENADANQRACHLELHAGADAAPVAPLGEGLTGLSAQAADAREPVLLSGTAAVEDRVQAGSGTPPVRFRRDVRAFFQGNRFLLEALVRQVTGLVPPGPVVDLYAGVGLFGLSLAAAGAGKVTLVEGDPISGADLQANAQPFSGVAQVERHSVERFLAAARSRAATFVVDPPRTGMSREALGGMIRQQPDRIVYVSCDVATLARDTRTLLDAGYELGEVSGMDLFPNTAHVETIATFTR